MSVFQNLYSSHFRIPIHLTMQLFRQQIETEADATFQGPILGHDDFFTKFTPIWTDILPRHDYFSAEEIWRFVLNITWSWEQANNGRVHKGTPYYFLGATQILAGKIEDGFYAMHQALEEDKLTSGRSDPQTPAYWFTTLNYENENQFFGNYVRQIAEFLDSKIEEYRVTRGKTLTLNELKTKLLENPNLREEVFRFVYFLSIIRRFLVTPQFFRLNEFSSLQIAKHLFDICLISEKIIEEKHPQKGVQELYFSNQLSYLRRRQKITQTADNRRTIRQDFGANFDQTLTQLLNNTHPTNLPSIDNDYMIAYYLRNFGAHNIINRTILNGHISELVQRILNTIFYTVEEIY